MKNNGLIRSLFAAGFLIAGFLFASAVAAAATLLSQAYVASEQLPVGSIVSLQKGTSTQVDGATIDNSKYLLGVIIQDDSSQISISSKKDNQVFVATSGIEPVLVSDINGDIVVGDPITASPIKGVGMKATGNSKIVGVAQDEFPNSTAREQSFNDEKGQKQTTKLGQVAVLVNVAYYYKEPEKTLIPSAVQKIADALAGKKVNSLPILISIGIFMTTMIIVVSIIYSMIKSSIISVGRNPMSQAAVYRNVMQLSALVIAILAVSVGSIYMVLTRF
ncbi:MAG TPA: hypothetical protein VI336_02240 [Candidatus Saccharimonadales bacterium]|nr:hypothetical protein [Candidatus Saccharimonadales bacterium]